MDVLLLATTQRKSGATFYARRLAELTGSSLLPAETPLPQLIGNVLRSDADVLHIELEYATFGSVTCTLLTLPLLVAIRRLRGPVVITFHGVVARESLDGFGLPRLVHAGFRISYRLSAALASAVTVHSSLMRDVLAREYGIPGAVVIPLGADGPLAVPPRPHAHHIAFFGFVRPSKGIEELIDAVALLAPSYPDLRLTIAGGLAVEREGSYLDLLRQRAERSGWPGRIEFRTGFLDENEKREIASSAAVLVLPYRDRYAEVSAVVHDFVASGVPLIVSDRPRFSELTHGVDCLKVEPDPAAIAGAIRRIFQDPSLAEELGVHVREKAAEWSWERIAEVHRRLYETLVRRKARPLS